MKYTRLAIIIVCLWFSASGVFAQERNFGMGAIFGEPTGLSGKAWTSRTTAFDFGVGWSFGGDRLSRYEGTYNGGNRVHLHVDYLWHSFNAIHSSERFPLYYGVG